LKFGRQDLIGKYVGHTAPRTQAVIDRAKGGVLFIDEAYSLNPNDSKVDFGNECISTLIKGMEDNRDNLCVILAGYTEEIQQLLKANTGFESRIQFVINFPDYSEIELYEIFKKLCKKEKYTLSSNIKQVLLEHFKNVKKQKNFSNARYVRSLFEKVKIEQADRVSNSEEDYNKILLKDIQNVIDNTYNDIEIKEKRVIGF
jgi:SpoVK/Ycf46/Vps4 family AAA+-type ATPase